MCHNKSAIQGFSFYTHSNILTSFFSGLIAEVGDYEPDEHGEGAGYLSEFKFCPKQVKLWCI